MALAADGGLIVSGRSISHAKDGELRTVYADETAAAGLVALARMALIAALWLGLRPAESRDAKDAGG